MCLLAVGLAVPVSRGNGLLLPTLSWYVCMSHIEKRHHATEAILTAGQDHILAAVNACFIDTNLKFIFLSCLTEKQTYAKLILIILIKLVLSVGFLTSQFACLTCLNRDGPCCLHSPHLLKLKVQHFSLLTTHT